MIVLEVNSRNMILAGNFSRELLIEEIGSSRRKFRSRTLTNTIQ